MATSIPHPKSERSKESYAKLAANMAAKTAKTQADRAKAGRQTSGGRAHLRTGDKLTTAYANTVSPPRIPGQRGGGTAGGNPAAAAAAGTAAAAASKTAPTSTPKAKITIKPRTKSAPAKGSVGAASNRDLPGKTTIVMAPAKRDVAALAAQSKASLADSTTAAAAHRNGPGGGASTVLEAYRGNKSKFTRREK